MPGEDSKPSESGVLTFRLPALPPSMNALYSINFNTRQTYMKSEVRLYKTQMKLFVPAFKVEGKDKVEIEIEAVGDWMFKNGNYKKADVQNLGKVLIDLIAEKQGWGDERVWRFTAEKVQSVKEAYVNVRIKRISGVDVMASGA